MTLSYSNSVIDSYTGLPWCGAGLHLLEVGKNAGRKPNGTIYCLPCAARARREERRRAAQAAAVTPVCTEPGCTDPGPHPSLRHLGAHKRYAHGPGFRRADVPTERTA